MDRPVRPGSYRPGSRLLLLLSFQLEPQEDNWPDRSWVLDTELVSEEVKTSDLLSPTSRIEIRMIRDYHRQSSCS